MMANVQKYKAKKQKK